MVHEVGDEVYYAAGKIGEDGDLCRMSYQEFIEQARAKAERLEGGGTMKARRKPCFDALSFDEIADNTDLGECMASRYYSGSEPDCSVLCNGGSWKTCRMGKLHANYAEWRRCFEDTVVCSKCHGTGRVKGRP